MINFINSLIDGLNISFLTAFLLGILTSISPCPLATNIAIVGFLSKEIKTVKNMLLNSIFYIIGRGISYTFVAILIYFGFSSFTVSSFFQGWGEKLLGPVLIVMGILMLDVIKINFSFKNDSSEKLKKKLSEKGYLGALGLGIIFALAFCPYSGVLFFGALIPLVLKTSGGLFLAPIFALGTGVPVVLFALIMSFSLQKMGQVFKTVQKLEKIMHCAIALLFILIGIYYFKFLFT